MDPGSRQTEIADSAALSVVTRNCLRIEWYELSDKIMAPYTWVTLFILPVGPHYNFWITV